MRTRLTTLCVALFLGIRAFAQTGDFVLANPDGSIFRPTNFWTANSAALSNALNISLLVPNSRLITTSGSLTGGGDLSANRTLSLVGDNASPGASTYYGTDGSGTKGFFALPSGGNTNGIADAPNNGVAHVRRNAGWVTNDFSLITGTASDGQIPAAIARDSEVTSLLSGYQPLNAHLTDLADGLLTGSKVGSGIDGANITTGTTGTGLLVRQSAAGGSSIGTNGAAVGYPAVYQPDGTIATTNSATVSNLTVQGTFDLGSNVVSLARGGTAGTNAAQALANIGAQATDPDLDDLADGSLTGSKVGPGIDGANITTGTTGTGLLVRQSAAGGSFAWDIDGNFSITNAAGEFYPVYTNAVPAGVARTFVLRAQQSGATNAADFNFGGRLVNRGGVATSTNWVEHYYVSEANSWCYLTNVGTNAVVYVRGPVNGPQHGRVWGTISTVTNGGTFAGAGSILTNGLRGLWAMNQPTTSDEPDLITGTNTLVISAGDSIPVVPIAQNGGRDFEAGDDDYGVAGQLPIGGDTSFTLLCWANMESGSVFKPLIRVPGTFSTTVSGGNLLSFTVFSPGVTSTLSGQNIGVGTNYLMCFVHDATNNTLSILTFEPAGPRFSSVAHSGGTTNSGNGFWVSAIDTDPSQNWDGVIGWIGFYDRAVPSNQLSQIYNSGTGLPFPWTP